jgi:restriction endonuclease S subunit
MIVPLKDISNIRTGITRRGNLQYSEDIIGDYVFIQPADIKEGSIVNSPRVINCSSSDMYDNHILRDGDLLIVNKGINYTTLVYKGDFDKAVASSSFFIIKVDDQYCLPEYLQWSLQQSHVKEYLSQNSVTSTVPSLKKSVLEGLKIKLPPINTQKYILEFLVQMKYQQSLLQSIIEKNEEYSNSYISELI